MSNNDAEPNEFIDEVTDGSYNLSCKEVILKLVKDLSYSHDRVSQYQIAELWWQKESLPMMMTHTGNISIDFFTLTD